MFCQDHKPVVSCQIEGAAVPLDGTSCHLEVCRCGAMRTRISSPRKENVCGIWSTPIDFNAAVCGRDVLSLSDRVQHLETELQFLREMCHRLFDKVIVEDDRKVE